MVLPSFMSQVICKVLFRVLRFLSKHVIWGKGRQDLKRLLGCLELALLKLRCLGKNLLFIIHINVYYLYKYNTYTRFFTFWTFDRVIVMFRSLSGNM